MYNPEVAGGQGSGLITDDSRDFWFDHMDECLPEVTAP